MYGTEFLTEAFTWVGLAAKDCWYWSPFNYRMRHIFCRTLH